MVELGKVAWAARKFVQLATENTIARCAPDYHAASLRRAKARGRATDQDGEAGAHYFRAVADDYEAIAEESGLCTRSMGLFRGQRVLELGPGDTKAVGLIARLRGASTYDGSDAFDIQSADEAYLTALYEPIMRGEGQQPDRDRFCELLANSQVYPGLAAYAATGKKADLVLSRAVLEHVDNLDTLFRDCRAVLSDKGVLIHKVDLRSHGLEKGNPLDFLVFPEAAYSAMTSHVGMPNRVRADEYFELSRKHGLTVIYAASTTTITAADVVKVRGRLARPFRTLSTENLQTLGIWLVQVAESHPLAHAATPWDATRLQPAPTAKLSRY